MRIHNLQYLRGYSLLETSIVLLLVSWLLANYFNNLINNYLSIQKYAFEWQEARTKEIKEAGNEV